MAFVSIKSDFADPKSQLNHFCLRYCQRNIHRREVEYFTYELGEQYQTIVILNCIKGNAFPGSICSSQRDAEWSAAKQALKAFTSLTEMILLPNVQEALQARHYGRNRLQVGNAEVQATSARSKSEVWLEKESFPSRMKDATATHATDAMDATSALAAKDHQDELSEERESTSPAGRRRRRGGRRRGGRRHRRNRYKSPADWTVEDVSRWIKEVKDGAFAMYAELFHIDGATLSTQNTSTLKELGIVALGPRKVLSDEIAKLFRGCGGFEDTRRVSHFGNF